MKRCRRRARNRWILERLQIQGVFAMLQEMPAQRWRWPFRELLGELPGVDPRCFEARPTTTREEHIARVNAWYEREARRGLLS